MTHDNDFSADLPKFAVNVVPTHLITSAHLASLLERYRAGDAEPLVFGDDNKPEAAVIPFSDLVGMLKRDRAEDHAFQTELAQRTKASDDSGDPGMALEELDDELGEPLCRQPFLFTHECFSSNRLD